MSCDVTVKALAISKTKPANAKSVNERTSSERVTSNQNANSKNRYKVYSANNIKDKTREDSN